MEEYLHISDRLCLVFTGYWNACLPVPLFLCLHRRMLGTFRVFVRDSKSMCFQLVIPIVALLLGILVLNATSWSDADRLLLRFVSCQHARKRFAVASLTTTELCLPSTDGMNRASDKTNRVPFVNYPSNFPRDLMAELPLSVVSQPMQGVWRDTLQGRLIPLLSRTVLLSSCTAD